ncbi:PAS domain S-box protein [Archangium primigenium]|uniref:PAS domain S-box protein n=1 Tax=[Archangium] primigenium TaxID=2792470 RepID=UPI00195857A0|nr:PAS domain S-box protein [Archangium primigenium]MBM7112827.1 PAS domain S-box protein [Archangium primigenium]
MPSSLVSPLPPEPVLTPAGGEMGERIRNFDWSTTPLGPLARWPASLRTTVNILLLAPLPMALLWGKEGILLYNDGYARIAAGHHPRVLGLPATEGWPEIADFNRGVIAAGLRGESLSFKDQHLVLHRNGVPEDTWLDLTYTPVVDEHEQPVGMWAIVVETTERVLDARRRLHAERDLLVANERVQLALDAGAVIGTWVWDVPQDHFTADTRFARTFAMNAEHLREGRPLSQVVQSIHPEDTARIEEAIGRAIRLGGPYRAEYRVRQWDGSWLWIEANGHCELDAQGRALRFPGVLLDIDARKRAESREAFLLDLSDRLRPLSEPRAIMGLSAELLGRRLAIHRAGYAEFDMNQPMVEFITSWSEGVLPFLEGRYPLALFGEPIVAALSAGTTVAFEDMTQDEGAAEVSDALGARAAVVVPLMRARVLRGVLYLNHREVRAWPPDELSLLEEVASRTWEALERALAEKELRELNATLERRIEERTRERNRLWELSQAPFLIADLQGRWVRVSPAWSKVLGWSEEELIGRTSEWMEHPEDRNATRSEVRHLAEGERTLRFENRFRHKDGSYRWFAWMAVPSEGLLYCVARDITEDKQREAELARIQEQLRQSQKMEAVGQLTGGIAHDFNNLLAGIVGALDLLARRLKSGKLDNVQRYIDAATASANRAAALTHRLLAFARRQSLDVKPTDINALVLSMEDLLHRTLGENVSLKTQLKGDLWTARTDANQFESALLNLVINARDAMPDGGKLTIETSNTRLDESYTRAFEGLSPGEYVVMCVSDTGTGMSADVVAKAFDPFFTTKPIGQGTGLGLSMIYGFVRQSGGHVRIYSELGQGTTVKLYLPRHGAEAVAQDKVRGEAQRALEGETVLVVEDDPSVRMVVVDVLEDLGYRALEAGDAKEAMPHLEGRSRIDLLVTDVGLPGMNGRQLAEVARQKRPGLKVLFATGYAEGAAVRGGFLAEGMEMITKPFAVDVLAARLRAMLSPEA